MLSKTSKWELGLIHYIAKFTISRFVISRFKCIYLKFRDVIEQLENEIVNITNNRIETIIQMPSTFLDTDFSVKYL